MENVDWAALPFNYHKTDYNVRISYRPIRNFCNNFPFDLFVQRIPFRTFPGTYSGNQKLPCKWQLIV